MDALAHPRLPHTAAGPVGRARPQRLCQGRPDNGHGRAGRTLPGRAPGLLAPYDNWHNREAIYRFVKNIPMRPSHPSYATLQHIENRLAQLRQRPICLVWGMRDWCFTPHFLRRFQEFFPQAEVHELAAAGHYVVEDAPQQIIPIVTQFLAHAANVQGPY